MHDEQHLSIYYTVVSRVSAHGRLNIYNSQFWAAWALTRDQNSIRLYRSCYSGPMKCVRYMGAYPGVGACPGHYGNIIQLYELKCIGPSILDNQQILDLFHSTSVQCMLNHHISVYSV